MMDQLGCLHIYTGDGKGKTTCAFGLALRCAGCGYRVEIFQFLKSGTSGEVGCLKNLANVHYNGFSEKHDFYYKLCEQEKNAVRCECAAAFDLAKKLVIEQKCDMIILDEIMAAVSLGLISLKEVIELAENHENVEVVMTGRDVPQELICLADYVSEIKMIKHPYEKGILARRGIEF